MVITNTGLSVRVLSLLLLIAEGIRLCLADSANIWRSKAEIEAAEAAKDVVKYRLSAYWSLVTKPEDESMDGLSGRYIVIDGGKLFLAPVSESSEKLVFQFNQHQKGFLRLKNGEKAYIADKYAPFVFDNDEWSNHFAINVQKENPVSSYTPFVLNYLGSPWFSTCKQAPGIWQVFAGKMDNAKFPDCHAIRLIMKREDTWLRYYFSSHKNPIDWKLVEGYHVWLDGKGGTGKESAKQPGLGAALCC
ncbi:hypothetical protein SJAG_01421 [Schizosaccharomyces japonicus yFS275]|uniref:Uncharacterized protein n=1 Tax=Schizosaccharomyces japonicus (strain yFS275 / FY16936) TaxID=402676 RepID=B6JXV8_SCHJY|nr:hypothetical protein SJAG_01421 [Schizosaccharomyces japonicus yFS275]EEB06376.1 hypothetical protein SJAG_01421 [Schizosaccharomyces japonicus yFS275]